MIAAAALCAAPVAMLCAAPEALARWSRPAHPAGCAVALSIAAPALIVFPSSGPQTRSGPGALLWAAPRGCRVAGGSGGDGDSGGTAAPVSPDAISAEISAAAPPDGSAAEVSAASPVGAAGTGASDAPPGEVVGATLAPDDRPGPGGPLVAAGGGSLAELATAVGTAAGQVVVAGSPEAAGVGSGAATGALAEGRTVGAFAAPRPLGGRAAPVSASSAYLGDTVLASPVPRARGKGWAIAVRVQRHYSRAFTAPRLVPVGPGPVDAVAAAMDYRADILLVWAAGGGVYAREIARSSTLERAHRLGGASGAPEIRALLSDDDHAIVAWRSQTGRGGEQGSAIELSISGADLAFGKPHLLEHFRDPPDFAPPAGSLRLVRLSSEAVMMAWTGIDGGRYVVRASPVSLRRGAWAPVTISAGAASAAAGARASAPGPASAAGAGTSASAAGADAEARGEDAVLADLVPGPDAEALALWSVAPRLPSGAPNPRRRGILAARGHYAGPGRVSFEAPEVVAAPGPNGPPVAAFDLRTGRALAAWATRGARASRIAYALRAAGPAASPLPAEGGAATGGPSPTIVVLSGLALLMLAVGAAARHWVPGLLPLHTRTHRG